MCSFLCGILLISICFVGCNTIAIIVIMIINVSVCSTAVPGVFANHADLAPNFSGESFGIFFQQNRNTNTRCQSAKYENGF